MRTGSRWSIDLPSPNQGPRRHARPVLLLTVGLSALSVIALGCSAKKATSTATSSATPTSSPIPSLSASPPPASTSPAPATPSTSPVPATPSTTPTSQASPSASAGGGLSGTWSGQYSGVASGTFTVTWQQSGSALTGTITLSGSGAVPITGTVNGDAIQFGSVGQGAVSYSGAVSGNSMSGTYQAAAGNGTWNATKS